MKKISILLCVCALLSCQKKKTESTDSTAATTTTTTGGSTTGNPTPASPAFAAELTVTNTDHSYSYAGAYFYETSASAVLIDEVKSNGKIMGQYPGNEYRYANASSNYTASVLWDISSSRAHIPDTSLYSPAFPNSGFTKNTGLIYDKTKDFSIPVDVSTCDTMYLSLGTVLKKIVGKSGTTSVTFKPTDGVKADSFDNTQVVVEVVSSNFNVFTVRGKKWKLRSDNTVQSHYGFK